MIFQQLTINFLIFLIGFFGTTFNYNSVLLVLIGIEIMLLSANLNFLIFSIYLKDTTGQLFSIFILTVAASEAAVGLAILIAVYQVKQQLKFTRNSICSN